MEKALYPGSFDPITRGHLNIIERALELFERITVLMAVHPQKQYLFSLEENLEMIRQAVRPWPQVEVDHSEGLTVEYARARRIRIALRGLRAVTDFEGEFSMALTNRSMWSEFETVFLMTDSEYMYLHSSTVRQIAQMGGDVSKFVPPCVERKLKEKFGYA